MNLAVIGVVGRYRSGKSFLLNRLLGQQSGGFKVAHETEGCTRGVWLWGERQPDQKRVLLLFDTEGLFDTANKTVDDTALFVLTVLLTSVLIFNTEKTIDTEALKGLSFASEFATSIRVRRPQPGESENEISTELNQHFPELLWLVRDFGLQHPDGQTDKGYLEKALARVASKIRGREGGERGARWNSGVLQPTALRHAAPSLRRHRSGRDAIRHALRATEPGIPQEARARSGEPIRQRAPLKSIVIGDGKLQMTGPLFLELAKQYVDALNKNQPPCIGDAWEAATRLRCGQTLERALAEYRRLLQNELATGYRPRWRPSARPTSQRMPAPTSCSREASSGRRSSWPSIVDCSKRAASASETTFSGATRLKARRAATRCCNACFRSCEGRPTPSPGDPQAFASYGDFRNSVKVLSAQLPRGGRRTGCSGDLARVPGRAEAAGGAHADPVPADQGRATTEELVQRMREAENDALQAREMQLQERQEMQRQHAADRKELQHAMTRLGEAFQEREEAPAGAQGEAGRRRQGQGGGRRRSSSTDRRSAKPPRGRAPSTKSGTQHRAGQAVGREQQQQPILENLRPRTGHQSRSRWPSQMLWHNCHGREVHENCNAAASSPLPLPPRPEVPVAVCNGVSDSLVKSPLNPFRRLPLIGAGPSISSPRHPRLWSDRALQDMLHASTPFIGIQPIAMRGLFLPVTEQLTIELLTCLAPLPAATFMLLALATRVLFCSVLFRFTRPLHVTLISGPPRRPFSTIPLHPWISSSCVSAEAIDKRPTCIKCSSHLCDEVDDQCGQCPPGTLRPTRYVKPIILSFDIDVAKLSRQIENRPNALSR